MNKIKIKMLPLAVLSFLFVTSCARELESADESVGGKGTLKFSVEAGVPVLMTETKTTFDGQTLVWTGKETMDVLIGNSTSTDATLAASSTLTIDPVTQRFTGTVDLGSFAEEDIRAVTVPGGSDAWIRSNTTLRARIPIPMVQTQEKPGVMNGDNFPLYAALDENFLASAKQADGSYEVKGLSLKWGCAVLCFDVYGTHPEMSEDEVLKSVTVRYGSRFPANFEVKLAGDEIVRNSTTIETTVNLLEGKTVAGTSSQNGQRVFMAMFPYANSIAEVRVTTDKGVYNLTGDVAPLKTISGKDLRGNVYRFGLNLEKFHRNGAREMNYYMQKVLSVTKRSGLPTIQVMYTKGDDVQVSLVAVNDEFYAQEGRVEYCDLITTSSVYQACSVGKVPMAYMTLKLVEEGKIDLMTPLYLYWADYASATDDEARAALDAENEFLARFADETAKAKAKLITAKMVLIHTTGLDNATYSGIKSEDDGDSSTTEWTAEPGYTTYKYSGPATHLLDLTLGKILGKNLEDYSKTYIFDKLGMSHTNYVWQSEYETLALVGHRADPADSGRSKGWSGSNAAYTLRTTAEDFTKFLRWTLDGMDLTEQHCRDMFTEYLDNQGYIWRISHHDVKGTFYNHRGNNGNYSCMVYAFPDTDETLAMFTNGVTSYNYYQPIAELFLGCDFVTGAGSALPEEVGTLTPTEGNIEGFVIKTE